MASENPQPALDALVGKEYEFRGQKVRNTNAAMLALARLGFRLEDFQTRAHEMLPIVIYSMVRPADHVYDALAKGELEKEAWMYCAEVSPEESGLAMAIFTDCLMRFHKSMTHYASEHSGKNLRAAAVTR